jgi:hypothetical protein
VGDELDDDLGVGGGLEVSAVAFEAVESTRMGWALSRAESPVVE